MYSVTVSWYSVCWLKNSLFARRIIWWPQRFYIVITACRGFCLLHRIEFMVEKRFCLFRLAGSSKPIKFSHKYLNQAIFASYIPVYFLARLLNHWNWTLCELSVFMSCPLRSFFRLSKIRTYTLKRPLPSLRNIHFSPWGSIIVQDQNKSKRTTASCF